ncbi:MAG: PTS sugar transporter subunit IIB, partial [Pseudomonadota bacterium]
LARFSQLAGPHGLPVAVIDMMDYGTLRGDKVLDQALSLIA